MISNTMFRAEYFINQKKKEKILYTRKHALLQNYLKYADQKILLSE